MNKKTGIVLIIWIILLLSVGLSWIGWESTNTSHCANWYQGECSGWEVNYNLAILIGQYLVISAPALILYKLFERG